MDKCMSIIQETVKLRAKELSTRGVPQQLMYPTSQRVYCYLSWQENSIDEIMDLQEQSIPSSLTKN